MAPSDSDMTLHSAPLAALLLRAQEEAEASAAKTRETHQALTKMAAIRQFKLAALEVQGVSPPIEALSAVSEHLRGEGCGVAVALAYQELRRLSLHDHPAVKPARIAICEAVVLFVAAAATHGDKEGFDRELAVALGEVPDDITASQLHMAYRHVMQGVPGAFKSGNAEKNRKKAPKQRAKRTDVAEKVPEPFEDVLRAGVMPSEPQSEPEVSCSATVAAPDDGEAFWHDETQRLLATDWRDETQRLLAKMHCLPSIIQDREYECNMLNDTLGDIYAGLWWYLERASTYNHCEEDRMSARFALTQFAQHQQVMPFPLNTETWLNQEFVQYRLQHRFTTVVLLFGVEEILAPLVHDNNETKLEAAYGALRSLNDLTPFSRQSALVVLQFALGQGQFEVMSLDTVRPRLHCRVKALGVVGSLLPGAFTSSGEWCSDLLDAALAEALDVSELCVCDGEESGSDARMVHVAFWAMAQMLEGAVRLCGQETRIRCAASTWLGFSLRQEAPGVIDAQEQAWRLISFLDRP